MEFREINIGDAKKRLDDDSALFVDIRDRGSFEASRIPGATWLGNDNINAFLADTAKDRPLIVYCYHGNNSKMGSSFLAEQGYAEVFSMAGGFEVWRHLHEFEAE
ncbi:MAG: thiosulfate sulfurtransferase GlpE [Planctomycetota bacterium]